LTLGGKSVYVAGPTEAPRLNLSAFAAAAEHLQRLGAARVTTPHDPRPGRLDLADVIRENIADAAAADLIVALPGTPEDGVELTVASVLGIRVVTLEEALAA
jgi:hypothetical protein